jgi:hypothetical protein
MSDTLALESLFDAVSARFVAEALAQDPPATAPLQVFGWREPSKRAGSMPRIVWVPGDDGSGDLGAFAAARQPGRNPRPLATIRELATVYIEAVDSTAPENERAQYRAARLLYDAWFRAVYLAARGTFEIRSHKWMADTQVRRYGATIRVVLSIEAMVPDEAYDVVGANARAVIDSILDETEDGTDETGPAPMAARAASTEYVVLLGEQTIDGVELVAGDRALVKDQGDESADNGIYVVAAGAWSRASDANTSEEMPSGLFVHVVEGTTNGDAGFELTTPDPIVLGTTSLVFERVSP